MFDSAQPISKQEFDASEPALSEHKATPELISQFSQKAIKVVCKQDEVLFKMGEPVTSVYLVRAGEVGLMMPVSHTHAMMGFRAESGSLVGLPAAFSNAPYSMTAVAWKGTELGVMSRERFIDMIATNPTLSLDVLKILAAETRSARFAATEMERKRETSYLPTEGEGRA